MLPVFNNNKVLCIGEVLWDNLDGKSMPGGAMLNITHHLHHFGIPVTLVSKVGTDARGIELLAYMKNAGLNTEAIYFDDTSPTSEVDVAISKFRNIKYTIGEPVAWDHLGINMRIIDHAGTAGAIVYGSLASRNDVTRATIDVLLNFDNVKIMDVNLRPPFYNQQAVDSLLHKADIVKVTEKELKEIMGWHNKFYIEEKERLEWFADNFKNEIVCLTKKGNSASVFYNGMLIEHPGYETVTIDNVGTGAAFLAGFIAGLILEKNIRLSLDQACAMSAIVAGSKGALPEYIQTKDAQVNIQHLIQSIVK
ncbi:MAG: hypothetical protein KDC05_14365 [Bacteroidales bacterium]|nr:hypothetical protein [Bacteroidales bacterium]